VWSSPGVVPRVLGDHGAQVPFAEGQHPVSDLGPGGERKPFGIGVGFGISGRDLDCFDAGPGKDSAERGGELPRAVADQEPEVRGAYAARILD